MLDPSSRHDGSAESSASPAAKSERRALADPGSLEVSVYKVVGEERTSTHDHLTIEEPLEIRLAFGARSARTVKAISVTMRTPGSDFELAAGFLFGEGIVTASEEMERVIHCGARGGRAPSRNVVRVELAPDVVFDASRLERHFYTSSSCGVCGKASLEALKTRKTTPLEDGFVVAADVIHALPPKLRAAQDLFARTGGLHAAGLFDASGNLLALREDVGRHNALDKLIGAHLLDDAVPIDTSMLLVSGRASFELVQKAVMARIPVLLAVGAPSSLAVDLAREFNMTLLGFVREGSFNLYVGEHRLSPHGPSPRETRGALSAA